MNNTEKSMEKIVALCKGRGFIFPGSDIYGGLANTWDYGPLGARLKNNVKDTWRKRFIQERKNSYEVDADILMHPRVWEASGHVGSFSDPLLDCKECKMRFRADNLIDDFDPEAHADGMTKEEMFSSIENADIIFLMGGDILKQNEFLMKNDLKPIIKTFKKVVIGISAGAINLSNISLCSKDEEDGVEKTITYEGIGRINYTIEPHFDIDNKIL